MKKTNKSVKPFVLLLSGVILICLILVIALLVRNNNGIQVMLSDNVDQIQGLESYAPSGELAKAFGDNVYYEVENIAWDGNTGKAEVKVITPDLAEIISNSIESAIGENGVDDYKTLLETVRKSISSTLASGKYPTLDRTVEMDAEKTDEGYKLISNDEFERIIAGNLEEIFIQALMEGLANENTN